MIDEARARGYADVGARLLIALPFLYAAGVRLLYFRASLNVLERAGLPAWASHVVCVVMLAVELCGGLALVAGFMTMWTAFVLFVAFVVETAVPHLVSVQYPAFQVVRDLAVVGGLVTYMVDGAGPVSVDAWREARIPKL